MKISPEKTQEVLNQITSKCTIRKCPMCGGNEWNIEDKIFELREFNNGNFVLGGDSFVMPIIAISCFAGGTALGIGWALCD